jgi:hypothetical protein
MVLLCLWLPVGCSMQLSIQARASLSLRFWSVSQFTCGVQNVHELAKIAARWRFRVHGALEIASASLQVCCFVHASMLAADV